MRHRTPRRDTTKAVGQRVLILGSAITMIEGRLGSVPQDPKPRQGRKLSTRGAL